MTPGVVFAPPHENYSRRHLLTAVLAASAVLTPDGVRWPVARRTDVQARATIVPRSVFVSHAAPDNFALLWPPHEFWAVISGLILGLTYLARAPLGRT